MGSSPTPGTSFGFVFIALQPLSARAPVLCQSNRLHQALDAVLTALVPFRVVPAIDSEMPSTSATSRMVPPLVRISVAIVSRNR